MRQGMVNSLLRRTVPVMKTTKYPKRRPENRKNRLRRHKQRKLKTPMVPSARTRMLKLRLQNSSTWRRGKRKPMRRMMMTMKAKRKRW